LDRREKLLSGLDVARASGIEIGPLNRPLILKSQGEIQYVDYGDAAFLREKYKDDPNVRGEDIPEIDAIWGDKTLEEALGLGRRFDYALASHVMEHVPDLIAWLGEVHAVLEPDGTLRVALPDRRFTFDFLRRESEVSDALIAHVMRARAPLPGQVLESCLNHQLVDRRDMWDGGAARQPQYERAKRLDWALYCARQVMETGVYIDVHCWVFTPLSFARLMEQLAVLGFLRFECGRIFPTERDGDEFIVIMRRSEDQARSAETWRQAAEALLAEPLAPLAATLERAAAGFQEGLRQQADAMARLEQRFIALERRAAPLAWLARRAWSRVRR